MRLLFIFCFFIFSQPTLSRSLEAHYKIVKDSRRTSSFVTSGTFTAWSGKVPQGDIPTHLKYKLKVKFYGEFSGVQSMVIPSEYFTEAFLVQLRKTRYFEGPNFKVKHVGFKDAKDYQGKLYKNCDQLYFYDIETVSRHYYRAPSNSRTPNRVFRIKSQLKDPKILASVKFGLPVIGAVSLDVTGSFMSVATKVGADLDLSR